MSCSNCVSNEKKEGKSDAWFMIEEMGRQNKRMFIALIAVLILWFGTIGGFVWYMNQYDFSTETSDFDTTDGGDANYIGNDGDIYNGTTNSD